MNTLLSKSYKVITDGNVELRVTIGHAQNGVTSVYLGKKLLINQQKDSLIVPLGQGSELSGNTLYCITTVADVRTETNETSVTFELTGGYQPFKQTLSETVEKEHGIVFYTAIFDFYS